MKILLVAATQKEINKKEFSEFDVLISGVGMINTTYNLTKILSKKRYDLVINMGIAGSYNPSIKIEYENNQSKMKGYKSQIQIYDAISLAGIVWLAYLYFTDSSSSISNNYIPTIDLLLADQLHLKFEWEWKL